MTDEEIRIMLLRRASRRHISSDAWAEEMKPFLIAFIIILKKFEDISSAYFACECAAEYVKKEQLEILAAFKANNEEFLSTLEKKKEV